jgi:hypothetical protein
VKTLNLFTLFKATSDFESLIHPDGIHLSANGYALVGTEMLKNFPSLNTILPAATKFGFSEQLDNSLRNWKRKKKEKVFLFEEPLHTHTALSCFPFLCMMRMIISNNMKVFKGGSKTLPIRADVINQSVTLEESLDPWGDESVPKLGHAGKEVMLNLEIEITHPPITPPGRSDVGGVVRGVANPVNMLVSLQSGLVSVTHREVDKDIHGTNPNIKAVHGHSRGDAVWPQDQAKNEIITEGKSNGLIHKHLASNVPWVKENLPTNGNQEGDHRSKEVCLHRNPPVWYDNKLKIKK